MTHAFKPFGLTVLLLGVSLAAHARRDDHVETRIPDAPSTQPIQIELVDGSVLQVPVAKAAGAPAPLGADGGNEAPEDAFQRRMLRRGQIFDPATPGVVASVRG